jgi:4-diphosphocytidyl-2-C-methyl-D-erythritol kinase
MPVINAPAKINLTFEVLGKRPDGYHEIRSIIQSVDLSDTITIDNSHDVSIECDMPGWMPERSLVSKAVALVRESYDSAGGIKLDIKKRIPLMSGLGGDSSDAAAVLQGLNELWELELTVEDLNGYAEQLGSDVFFFLNGATALVEGRGEIVKALPSLPRMWVVLVVPDIPPVAGKTASMYAGLKAGHFTDGTVTRKLADTLHKGSPIDSSLLFNTFENIAFDDFKMRRVYLEHLDKLGATHVHLCGSGPALYTVYKDEKQAEDLYTRCKDQGMQAYMVNTL